MGRPTAIIKQDEFEELCKKFFTLNDIALYFGVNPSTIERWCKRTYKETFANAYNKFSAKGKLSIRAKQFELAMKGNVPLLMFLGKVYCDQKENINLTGNMDINVSDVLIKAKERVLFYQNQNINNDEK